MANLDDILIFVRVAQFESISGAARSLGMPISTVSRRLSVLESKLVTQRRRRIVQEGALQIKIGAVTVWQFHLTIDEFRYACIHSTRACPFRRDQAPDSCIDEGPFRSVEVRRRVVG
jgi:hypothetical protein